MPQTPENTFEAIKNYQNIYFPKFYMEIYKFLQSGKNANFTPSFGLSCSKVEYSYFATRNFLAKVI